MDNNERIKVLSDQVREALDDETPIIIVGWKDSNHDDFTKSLPEKKILFLGNGLNEVRNKQSGFVIKARFIDHKLTDVIKSNRLLKYNPAIWEIKQIKKVLKNNENIISTACSATQGASCCSQQTKPEKDPLVELDDLEAALATPETEMDECDRFAMRFNEEAQKHPDQLVSAPIVGQIRREVGIKKHSFQLSKKGWLISVTQEGKKSAGWYKAGPELIRRLSNEKLEPSDPIDKAQFLIENETRFQEELEIIQGQLEDELQEAQEKYAERIARAQKRLGRVETAKELIEKLEAL